MLVLYIYLLATNLSQHLSLNNTPMLLLLLPEVPVLSLEFYCIPDFRFEPLLTNPSFYRGSAWPAIIRLVGVTGRGCSKERRDFRKGLPVQQQRQ